MLVVRFAATRKYKNQAKEKQQNGDKYEVAHFCYFFPATALFVTLLL